MSAMASSSSANPSAVPSTSTRQYVFTQEIARMAYVQAQLTDPDESTLRHIEDLVRTQLVEVVLQARAQASRRNSRQLIVEDLLFLIRHDKAKLNRIRAYLSSRSAHQKYPEVGEADDDREVESWAFQMDQSGTDQVLHVGEVEVRLPWEVDTKYDAGLDDDDDDDKAVAEENKQRLKALDLITRKMSKEEYIRYTESRQATFVGRKSSAPKKFRDFLSMAHLLEGPPSDDVLDVFAFLAYELVGTLCAAGLAHRRHAQLGRAKAAARDRRLADKRKAAADVQGSGPSGPGPARGEEASASPARAGAGAGTGAGGASPSKKGRTREPSSAHPHPAADEGGPGKSRSPPSRSRTLVPPTSLFSEPLGAGGPGGPGTGGEGAGAGGMVMVDGVLVPREVNERPTLELEDLHAGFFGLQQGRGGSKASGMANWRAGASRRRGVGVPMV